MVATGVSTAWCNVRASNADMEGGARHERRSVFDTLCGFRCGLRCRAILALALFVFIRAIGAIEDPRCRHARTHLRPHDDV